MAGYSVPQNSPYYYGEDSTYKPAKRKVKPVRETVRPEYNLDSSGLPVRVNPVANSQNRGPNAGMRLNENNDQVRAGGSIYSKDGKTVTTNGVTYDLATGQAINPATGKISPGGYSIDPKTKNRTDYKTGESRIPVTTTTSPISRDVDRGGAKGTQTSPAPAKPGDLNAFADLLGSKYGIQFRNGFESNKLPGTGIGPVADGDEYGKHLDATKGTTGIGPFADGDTYARAINGNKGEIAEGAQKGTSAVPDVGDQKRAVRVGRFDPRQRDGGSSSFMAEDSGPIVEQGPKKGGISARSRAFLDYDGPGGSIMALRAAEAESGYIRQYGKNYAISGMKDGKREFTEFNDEGRRALVKDGNARVSQQFLKDYMVGQTDAKAAENPAVEAPVEVKPRLEPNANMGPLADTEQYGKMLDATKGMTGMGPLANGEVYGAYLDGREPMMRDPRKK